MTARVLPPAEWAKLDATYLASVWRTFKEGYHYVLVVEDDGVIVGTWTFQWWAHVEGLSITADHQKKGRVGALLLHAMSDFVLKLGAHGALTSSDSAEVTGLLDHIEAVPMPHYFIPFRQRADRARGHRFHVELKRAGLDTFEHPDDSEHDTAVGCALRLAFDEQQPDLAREAYNRWAASAGYEPISSFASTDETTTVQFGGLMTVTFDQLGHVLKGVVCR